MYLTKKSALYALLVFIVSFAACQKNASTSATDTADLTESQVVAIAATTSGDSLYVVGVCGKREQRDSINFSRLPGAAITYLSDNYSGYTALKAYAIKDSSGSVTGYVAIINFNGTPVGISFDAGGAFVKVLEQREGRDLNGHGWHAGGRFDDRDGKNRDTIALSALPASVTGYISANYPQDTLLKAVKNRDSSIMVISTNNSAFATVFSATGTFIKRISVPAKSGKITALPLSAIPAKVESYLSTTYPNYVLKQAFSVNLNGTIKGYIFFIDANDTKYAITFDADAHYVKAVTIK